jgi:hypothetical protein
MEVGAGAELVDDVPSRIGRDTSSRSNGNMEASQTRRLRPATGTAGNTR